LRSRRRHTGWYTTHKPVCTYHTIRDQIKRRIEPANLIEKHYLQRRQVYLYTLHHGKLALLFSYPYHRSYEPLRDYLASVTRSSFPHHRPSSPSMRLSFPSALAWP
jgi:hypothetical protein